MSVRVIHVNVVLKDLPPATTDNTSARKIGQKAVINGASFPTKGFPVGNSIDFENLGPKLGPILGPCCVPIESGPKF